MADTDALESLAEILPADRREQFFAFVSKFRSRPEDDDHFQMLEAIGFMMLVMKEIPEQIACILEKAQTKLGATETEQLRSEIVAILADSLDTPSYKDLRETMLAMRDHEARFRQKVDGLNRQLTASELAVKKSRTIAPQLWGGLVAGVVVATTTVLFVMFGLPQVAQPKPVVLPEKLRPYAALLERGQLDYFEMNMADSDERVGMFLIGGGAKDAFRDGDHGVVVVPLR